MPVRFSLNMKFKRAFLKYIHSLAMTQMLVAVIFQKAAALLGVAVTSLKTLCRKQGLTRWPYRKRKSEQLSTSKKQKVNNSEI